MVVAGLVFGLVSLGIGIGGGVPLAGVIMCAVFVFAGLMA
jgi:hypothetical protein